MNYVMVIHLRKISEGFNIKSTGFTIANQTGTLYFTDVPDATGDMGVLSVVRQSAKLMNIPLLLSLQDQLIIKKVK